MKETYIHRTSSSIQYDQDAVPLCAKEHERFCPTPHPKWLFFGMYIALERVTSQSAAPARSHDALCSEVMAQSVKVCYQMMQKNVAKF